MRGEHSTSDAHPPSHESCVRPERGLRRNLTPGLPKAIKAARLIALRRHGPSLLKTGLGLHHLVSAVTRVGRSLGRLRLARRALERWRRRIAAWLHCLPLTRCRYGLSAGGCGARGTPRILQLLLECIDLVSAG
jgi:hypothetical protein